MIVNYSTFHSYNFLTSQSSKPLAEVLNKLSSQMKFIIFFLGISTFCFSQKFSFIYETKYKLNSEKPDDVNSDYMILDLKKNSSIFRDSLDKNLDSIKLNNGHGRFKMGVENQFYIKKNLAQKRIEKVITYLGTDYLLPVEEILNWNITSEQKLIGKYRSQKAETHYGGRNWIAWFTTELPFADGPYIFSGLPGLIVSIQDSNNEYSFNLIEVKKGGNIFDARTKTVKIDWKKYETLAKSYFNDPFNINSKGWKTATFTDPKGNTVDISIKVKEMQNNILQDNNPIELNRKINYK
ncbi:GLPGLI family protein [Chryseobacterium sp. YIM B08800]|uniref:GLPGLI family protein n=1 Tax=Chryseobacterium sp. YIM B08800 TaxID=2984136 RepID=UPI00223F58F5|nr:GLPGLI family protein [Chryseobacterium sp. YIM B08800]